MWISREIWQQQHDQGVRDSAIVATLQSHNIALQTTMDWLRVRLTQLEHERAQLIYQYMGVKIAVPSIEAAPSAINPSDLLNALPSFEDVGDEEAARQGIGWNETGEVAYSKRS